MSQTLTIPWNAWFSKDEIFSLSFPDDWQISLCRMNDAPALSQQAIMAAFDAPIGAKSIRELAQGKSSAAVVIDDISRPMKGADVLPFVIEEISQGGISKDCIKIIVALGAHRPMVREDFIMKVGKKIYNEIDVMNHYLYENLVDAGQSDIGTPIHLNRYFMESDLKVSVSSIIPHEWAGFGGGAKNVLPGVAGKKTLIANHKMVESCYQGMTGVCEPNQLRSDIENIAKVIGLDVTVNVVTNTQRETVGVFVGDFVKAHRQGVEFARKVCATELVFDQDVIILNAYPKDTEIIQITNALNILHMPDRDIVKKDGIIILTSACHEGRGYHAIMGHGTPLCFDPEDTGKMFGGRTTAVFSPNLNRHDMKYYLPESTRLFNQWESVIRYIKEEKKGNLKVGIYPTASLQLPKITK